jgi:hypothetical protein
MAAKPSGLSKKVMKNIQAYNNVRSISPKTEESIKNNLKGLNDFQLKQIVDSETKFWSDLAQQEMRSRGTNESKRPNLDEAKKKTLRNTNPCWKDYHPVGTKKKNGRTVPNCVPKPKSTKKLDEGIVKTLAGLLGAYYGSQAGLPDIMMPDNMPMGTYTVTQHALGGLAGYIAASGAAETVVDMVKSYVKKAMIALVKKTFRMLKTGGKSGSKQAWKMFENGAKAIVEKAKEMIDDRKSQKTAKANKQKGIQPTIGKPKNVPSSIRAEPPVSKKT